MGSSTSKRLFIVIAALSLFITERASASCGKFVVVKGDVQIDIAKTQKNEKAKVNSEICAGDSVTAGKEARAKIVMVDGNELNISPETKMTIEGYEFQPEQEKKKVLLNVLFGKVRANVKQKYDDQSKDSASNSFQVKTKSAVAGVRGTDFLTSYAPTTGKSEVVTFSGKVDVGQVGPGGTLINAVSVTAGQKTVAAPNQPPAPPVAVPPSELKQLNNSSSSSSNTQSPSGATASNTKGGSSNSNSDSKDSKSSSPSGSGSGTAGSASSGSGGSNSSSSANSTTSPSAGSDQRAPASGGSIALTMTDSKDIGGAAGQTQTAAPTFSGPALPPIPMAPPGPVVPVIPTFATIVQAGGPAVINISIIPHK